MLVKIEARILIFPGTDFHFPSTSVPPGTFFRLCPGLPPAKSGPDTPRYTYELRLRRAVKKTRRVQRNTRFSLALTFLTRVTATTTVRDDISAARTKPQRTHARTHAPHAEMHRRRFRPGESIIAPVSGRTTQL